MLRPKSQMPKAVTRRFRQQVIPQERDYHPELAHTSQQMVIQYADVSV